MGTETDLVLNAVILAVISNLDKRSCRVERSTIFSTRNSDNWRRVQISDQFEGWFQTNLRCSKRTFNLISTRVQERWLEVFYYLIFYFNY